LAAFHFNAATAAMGLATRGQRLLGTSLFRVSQPAFGARGQRGPAGACCNDDAGVRAAAAFGGVASGAVSGLDRVRNLSDRRVLVAEPELSYTSRMRFGILWASVGLLLLAAAPGAEAQRFDSIGKGGTPAPPPPKVEPPPALPGAQSSNNGAAPATKTPTDMEPNDALFDAINRGDLAAARDAISRGADLNAQSILGMTPLELAIDLGRNDISFMLLSMRGNDGGQRPSQSVAKVSAKPGQVKQAKQTATRSAKVAKVADPAATQTPRLFAGDGGTPNPNAGFLGFDSSHR
jgi:hypothetical protein